MMQGLWHWLQEHAIGITVGVTFLLLALGLWLLMRGAKESRGRDIGIALVTGGCFTLASLLVQLTLEKSNFLMTISVTDDLTGFDASGRVLEETTLAGKTSTVRTSRGRGSSRRISLRPTSPKPGCRT